MIAHEVSHDIIMNASAVEDWASASASIICVSSVDPNEKS